MNRTCTLFAAAILVAGAGTANAQGYGHGYRYSADEVDARQARQVSRIERGYRDHSLTAHEASRLMEQQRQIAGYERRAKADGYLDRSERSMLRHMQDDASRSIARERHDFEGRNASFDRPWYRRWWW